jgi:hypothetical protein
MFLYEVISEKLCFKNFMYFNVTYFTISVTVGVDSKYI